MALFSVHRVLTLLQDQGGQGHPWTHGDPCLRDMEYAWWFKALMLA